MAREKSSAAGILILLAALLALILASGLGYEQVERGRDRGRFPQIGRSLDIGGRSLNIDCAGTGRPAVIFSNGSPFPFFRPREIWKYGAPQPGLGWSHIQRAVAKFTRACWYDRAGAGWSDLGPYPRTAAAAARDLHALLLAAALPPPYILLAGTSAALDARVFTGFYPSEVAGLVLVDPVHPDLFSSASDAPRRQPRLPRFVRYSQSSMAEALNLLGFYRLVPPAPAPAPPNAWTSAEWDIFFSLTQTPNARTALTQEVASWDQSTAEARAAGSLGNRPLFILSPQPAGAEQQANLVLQADLAHLSTRGRQIVLPASGILPLQFQAPDAVLDAVQQVARQNR